MSRRACWERTRAASSDGEASGVPDQSHEAFVLMVLMMAMEERQAGVIGDEVDLRSGEPGMFRVSFMTPEVALSPILTTSKV
jgi:hypothetical protein